MKTTVVGQADCNPELDHITNVCSSFKSGENETSEDVKVAFMLIFSQISI